MKKSEKLIVAFVLMALGVLFIILKDNFIGILMTVAGLGLIALGVVDLVARIPPQAIVKILSGGLLIIAGWAIVEAVLYIMSGLLLVGGTLLLYAKIKRRTHFVSFWQMALAYATPVVCISIGILLLFHNGNIVNLVCIFSGILTALEGGVLLFCAFNED